eukprot:gnl/MRDRNA2_/MRDRNA2_15133_c0_seq1.p1 gnl/MRDRNA2_/MRDRNA2_15133_c0~~gnl/MRDRNA2_/MRDRNA2_15133_c0_seq1.p1  ORF type:complete len:888 (-),score=186.48 gnl/MRDRNA2_/MRDRNA2_15133_c0_seq1:74-2383(-)
MTLSKEPMWLAWARGATRFWFQEVGKGAKSDKERWEERPEAPLPCSERDADTTFFACTLHAKEILFIPKKKVWYSMCGLRDTNLAVGWMGETSDKERYYHAVNDGNMDLLYKTFPSDDRNEISRLTNQAVQTGHVDVLKYLEKRGAEFDEEDQQGTTHLQNAVLTGQVSSMEFIVSKGSEIHHKDKHGSQALHIASLSGHQSAAEFLLKRKAKLDVEAQGGTTPLQMSVLKGHMAVMQLLVKNKANIQEKQGPMKQPLLLYAVDSAQTGMAEYLIKQKADPDSTASGGMTAMHAAAYKGHMAMAESLLKLNAKLEPRDRKKTRPIHLATEEGHVKMVSFLIDRKANFNSTEGPGAILNVASKFNHKDIMELIERRSKGDDSKDAPAGKYDNDDAPDPFDASASEAADPLGMTEEEKIAQVEEEGSRPKGEKMPIHAAMQAGHVKLLEDLLPQEADVSIVEPNGGTQYLHRAVLTGHAPVVKFFVNRGANPDAADFGGLRPLHLAAKMGHSKCTTALLKNGATPDIVDNKNTQPLLLASLKGSMPIIKSLVNAGSEVNGQDEDGTAPLHIAAQQGHHALTSFLISKKADVHMRDNNGSWPLMMAVVRNGSLPVVEELVENGAEMNETYRKVVTPMRAAAKFGQAEVIKYFLEKGLKYDNQTIETMDNWPRVWQDHYHNVMYGEKKAQIWDQLMDEMEEKKKEILRKLGKLYEKKPEARKNFDKIAKAFEALPEKTQNDMETAMKMYKELAKEKAMRYRTKEEWAEDEDEL